MNDRGERNGFGVLYDGSMMVVGWFVNDVHHGNCTIVRTPKGKGIPEETNGWFDMGDREGEYRH